MHNLLSDLEERLCYIKAEGVRNDPTDILLSFPNIKWNEVIKSPGQKVFQIEGVTIIRCNKLIIEGDDIWEGHGL